MLGAGGDGGEVFYCASDIIMVQNRFFFVIKEQNTEVKKEIPLHWLFMEAKI